jgi:hypothetical protein
MRRVTGACCECAALLSKLYAKANHEKVKAWKAADQKKHRDSANKRSLRWYHANRDQAKAATAAWQRAHPDKGAAKTAKYLAAKRNQVPAWADKNAIDLIYRAAEVIRASGFDVHVDHEIPLQGKRVSGLHVHTNLQIIGAASNRSKSNHF